MDLKIAILVYRIQMEIRICKKTRLIIKTNKNVTQETVVGDESPLLTVETSLYFRINCAINVNFSQLFIFIFLQF